MKVNWTKITDTAFQMAIPNTNFVGFFVKKENFNRLVLMVDQSGNPVWSTKEYRE